MRAAILDARKLGSSIVKMHNGRQMKLLQMQMPSPQK